MTDPTTEEFLGTLQQVNEWPVDKRVELTQRVLSRIADESRSHPGTGKKSLVDLVGLLKTGGQQPTDEEIQAMIDERRMRKYRQ